MGRFAGRVGTSHHACMLERMRPIISAFWLMLVGMPLANASDLCPTTDISLDAFLVRFAHDKAFQLDRVIYPLWIKYTPPASETPIVERWSRARLEKIDWPLFLPQAELKRWRYAQTVSIKSATKAIVKHNSGTDSYLRVFTFKYKSGCWYLERFTDESL